MLGVSLSRGAIQGMVDRVSEALMPLYEAIAHQARSAPVNSVAVDTWYQHGVLAWLWVMVNTTGAFFNIQASRNKVAFAALVARWAGILVSDGDGLYQQWGHGRQTCLAHLTCRARGTTCHIMN